MPNTQASNTPSYPSNSVWALLILEIIILLLPSTLLYIFGGGMLILAGLWSILDKPSMASFFTLLPLLILGYGLFSLWWLIFKFNEINYQKIPSKIWTGLIAGGVSSLAIMALEMRLFTIPNSAHGWARPAAMFVLWGGGPFIVLMTLLKLLHKKPSHLIK